MQPKTGFYVGFSGGKDSQVVLELVKVVVLESEGIKIARPPKGGREWRI